MTDEQADWLAECPLGSMVNRVRLAMVLSHLDNSELARRTGLTPQYISAVSTGRQRNLTLRSATTIAAALGLPIEVVFPVTTE